MNNTKSQNGNLYSLTLLVKKNKKNFGKERTNERERENGGVGMAFAWEAANRGCHGGFKEGPKAQKAYYLRAKHTISRKYGTKKAENRPQKAKNRSPSLNPGETG